MVGIFAKNGSGVRLEKKFSSHNRPYISIVPVAHTRANLELKKAIHRAVTNVGSSAMREHDRRSAADEAILHNKLKGKGL